MVASGLVNDRVDVSQYRLATHLGLAFIILGLLYWTWRTHRTTWQSKSPATGISRLSGGLLGLVYLQIILGAFVAGTHAGKTYNTWPLMDGSFVPDGYALMSPFWRNWTENITAIQFNHRTLAYLIAIATVVVVAKAWSQPSLRRAASFLGALVAAQVALGIWTLVAVAPLSLSLAHQFLAIWVFLASLACYWRTRFIR